MAKFCTKCGTQLDDKGNCPKCPPAFSMSNIRNVIKRAVSKVYNQMGLGGPYGSEREDLFESNKNIVPDIILTNEDETPIKQYDIAKLRSRILGKYAEGRLQITNKRLIFRAAGTSYVGKQVLQHEFNIDEIGGIEIRKSHRLSFLNILLSFMLTLFVTGPIHDVFSAFNDASSAAATFFAISFTFALGAVFFFVKKKFWLKLVCLAVSIGMLSGLSSLTAKAYDYLLGEELFNFIDFISAPVLLLWFLNVIIVSMVPDLRICIKTKSAGDAIEIRRKIWGAFYKDFSEHTDYSEVLPWTETELAINEIGAIIDDLHTSGDYAIEKWKTT